MTEYYGDGAPTASDGVATLTALLDECISLIENAKSMPLSSSALISREEVLDLLFQARGAIPEELTRARRLLAERNEMWAEAEREANALLDEARAQAAHLVQRTEVVRQANAHAERLVAEAEARATSMRREAEDYIDRKLAAAEIVVDRVARTLSAGRERLKLSLSAADGPPAESPVPENPAGTVDLFDQDFR